MCSEADVCAQYILTVTQKGTCWVRTVNHDVSEQGVVLPWSISLVFCLGQRGELVPCNIPFACHSSPQTHTRSLLKSWVSESVLGRNVIYGCPVPLLIMNNLLLAAITESKLSQPDSCPSPGQLLCMCPPARAGWCAGTPKQPFRPHGTWGSGTQVLLGQYRGCSYCVVESYKQLVNLQRTLFPEPFCLPWRFLDACACSNPALTLTPNVSASLSGFLCWSSKSSHFHVHVESPCLRSLQNDLWTVELYGCRIKLFALLSSALKFSWCVIGLTVACQSYDTTEHFITSRDRYHFHLCWLLLSAFEGKSRK